MAVKRLDLNLGWVAGDPLVADDDAPHDHPWVCEGCATERCPCTTDPAEATWIGTTRHDCGCTILRALCDQCRGLRSDFEAWSASHDVVITCTGCGARLNTLVTRWSPLGKEPR